MTFPPRVASRFPDSTRTSPPSSPQCRSSRKCKRPGRASLPRRVPRCSSRRPRPSAERSPEASPRGSRIIPPIAPGAPPCGICRLKRSCSAARRRRRRRPRLHPRQSVIARLGRPLHPRRLNARLRAASVEAFDKARVDRRALAGHEAERFRFLDDFCLRIPRRCARGGETGNNSRLHQLAGTTAPVAGEAAGDRGIGQNRRVVSANQSRASSARTGEGMGRRRNVYLLSALLSAFLIFPWGLTQPLLLDDLRNFVFNSFQRAAPRRYDRDAPVRVVGVDDESLTVFGEMALAANASRRTDEQAGRTGRRGDGLRFHFRRARPDEFRERRGVSSRTDRRATNSRGSWRTRPPATRSSPNPQPPRLSRWA